jgi:type VI secretion system secreted protein Hcp
MALFDAFLKIDGIKGESQDDKHKGEIDIMSFSWGLSNAGEVTGSGIGSGKVSFQDIHFVKKTDASSPLLMLNCAGGNHIKEANFVVRKAGGTQLEYLKIKLTDVLISSLKPGGSAGALPTEQLSINFSKVEMTYQPQGADGKAQGGPILAGFDVKANKKV